MRLRVITWSKSSYSKGHSRTKQQQALTTIAHRPCGRQCRCVMDSITGPPPPALPCGRRSATPTVSAQAMQSMVDRHWHGDVRCLGAAEAISADRGEDAISDHAVFASHRRAAHPRHCRCFGSRPGGCRCVRATRHGDVRRTLLQTLMVVSARRFRLRPHHQFGWYYS